MTDSQETLDAACYIQRVADGQDPFDQVRVKKAMSVIRKRKVSNSDVADFAEAVAKRLAKNAMKELRGKPFQPGLLP